MNICLSPLSGKQILITGATGFIGTHLCQRLRNCGAEVHAVSRRDRPVSADGIHWWRCDLAEFAAAHALVNRIRPNLIFHLASHVAGARDLAMVHPTLRNNLLAAVNLMSAAVEFDCRVILAGSMDEPEGREDRPIPCSPYAAAKWAAAGYARMFHALYGLEAIMLRIFMVYGPGQRDIHKFIPYVTLSLLRGETPRLSSGRRPVDWIFIGDVIDGLVAAATVRQLGGVSLDLGSGSLVTLREVAHALTRFANPAIMPLFGALEDRPFEVVRVADVRHTERLLGWRPKTSLDDGLRMTVEWYIKSYGRVIEQPDSFNA